ncbi:MAG: hypothetical protein H7242_16305 [Microbacteriaceae bacterium]|nr:hypothetical protein [Burkholderiaceae bacterium]
MTISVTDYFMGRRETHSLACSPTIERNAARTVGLVNGLLARALAAGVVEPLTPAGAGQGTQLTSGWRPPDINACTSGASATSLHMTGEAADVFDPGDKLDAWLMSGPGQAVLIELGLWLEHPRDTPGWAHVQIRPPGSGRRVFYAK